MTALAYADVEMAVRTWARANSAIQAVVGSRVMFGIADDYLPEARGAVITMSLIGSTPNPTTPLNLADIQFSCWGATKGAAAAVHLALIGALHSLTRTTVSTPTGPVILADAVVTGALFSPDVTTDPPIPRYIVTALIGALPG